MEEDFDGWIDLKKDMDELGKLPTINEGGIWWCGVGTNYSKMGQVPKSDLEKVKAGFLNLYQ